MAKTVRREPQRQRGLVLLLIALLMPLQALAQANGPATTYRLVNGDQVQLSVPGRPDLTLALSVDGNGRVPIPQVGDVALAGLTVAEAELVLRQRLRLFDPSVDTVQLTLASQGTGVRIYVIGEVGNTGEYSFNTPPSLWDVLRAAGGPGEAANLNQARVVREAASGTQVSELDLSGIMTGAGVPTFELRNGDTLVIPATLEGVSSVASSAGVQVFGGVEVPTVVPIKEPTPLLDVIMLAGSPSDDALLNQIWWVHRSGEELTSRKINLEKFIKDGNPLGNPLVYPGDAVHVKFHRENWFQRNLPLILSTVTAMTTLWLAYDRAQE
jgi:polysaccharide export outer membrane protein|nr:polysaccharide biosynthesis/export family protein [Candidatus Krumholzibacteria bacterium]